MAGGPAAAPSGVPGKPGPDDVLGYEADPLQEECVLPLGCLLRGLQVTERDPAAKRGAAYLLFLFFFLIVACWARPVSSVFEVQQAVAQSLEAKSFSSVSSYDAFWDWARTVLYRQAFRSSDFNGGNHSSVQAFVLAKYNQLITPIRFRQVRSKQGSCSWPAGVHEISRPCWPEYSGSSAEEGLRNSSLGSAASYHAEGLSPLAGDESYGTGGHVTDLELDADRALAKLQAMTASRWTDEWTRAVAVEINVYNAAYGVAAAFRFQAERSLGGRLEARVDASSCPLRPYVGAAGVLRVFLEVMWFLGYLGYVGAMLLRWFRSGTRAFLGQIWTWVEILCLFCFAVIIVGWLDYLGRDRGAFEVQHPAEFKDLHSLCGSYNATTGFAAFSVVWAFVRVLRSLRLFPPLLLIWQTLAHCISAALPFTAVLLLFACALSHSGTWLFGARVHDFHTWGEAFALLFRSMAAAGLPDGLLRLMGHASPVAAPAWAILWALLSELIVFNMCIAILVSSFAFVARRTRRRESLEQQFPPAPWLDHLRSKCSRRFKDPDVREAAERALREQRTWREGLEAVDRERLQAAVLACVARGACDFEVRDAMQLFEEHRDPAERCRRAAAWMHGLAERAGLKLKRAKGGPNTAREIRGLMEKLGRLEEEAFGLTLQLQGAAPLVPAVEPI